MQTEGDGWDPVAKKGKKKPPRRIQLAILMHPILPEGQVAEVLLEIVEKK